MRNALVVVVLLAFPAATASDESKTALIEEMFVLTRMEELTKVGQIEGFKMGLNMAPVPIPEAKKERLIAEGIKVMEEVMPWSEMKKDFIDLFATHYTTEELKTIIELCKDPRYKLFVAKQIEIVGPTMAIGQKYGQLLTPKLMPVTMKIMQEP